MRFRPGLLETELPEEQLLRSSCLRYLLAAALSAHRSAAFDVHVLAGSGCGAAGVAGSGFAVVVAGEEAGERVDEVE